MERNNRKREAEHGADEQSGISGTSRQKFPATSAAVGAGGVAFTGAGRADEHGDDGSGGMHESDDNQSEDDGMGEEGADVDVVVPSELLTLQDELPTDE